MKYWEVMKYFIEDKLAIRRDSWPGKTYLKLLPVPSYLYEEDKIMYIPIRCNPDVHLMEFYQIVDRDGYTADDWDYLTKEDEDGLCRRSNCCLSAWKENQETVMEANGTRFSTSQ